MRKLRTSVIAAAVSGTLVGGDRPVWRVVIDSRESVEGSLFFALAGERTDGHRFVEDALRRGAAAAVVRRDSSLAGPRILVADPAEAA